MIPHSKPTIGKKEIKEIIKVLNSGKISQGKYVLEFERKLSKFIGVKYAVATSSGTSALHLALIGLGIKEGDEVIIPNYVCSALLNTIFYVRAKPVICDVNTSDFNISHNDVKKKITKRTKLLILPHMFGLAVSLDEFVKLGIPFIEDCAQSIGGTYNGKKLGSFGKISIVSFYATKMLTTGEGGMLVSNSGELINKIRDLRDYDEKNNFKIRYNYKMTDFQAALGIVQLSKINEFIKRRRKIAKIYNTEFSSLSLTLPESLKNKENIFYRYLIRVKRIEKIISEFKKRGIEVKRPVYKPLSYYLKEGNFFNTEKIMKTTLSIPIYPSLKKNEINKVVKATKEIFK